MGMRTHVPNDAIGPNPIFPYEDRVAWSTQIHLTTYKKHLHPH